MGLTKKDVENDDASQCEGCGKIILQDDVYPHEFYEDKELTDLVEDILYCKECAKKLFTKEEFEYGCKKEYAY